MIICLVYILLLNRHASHLLSKESACPKNETWAFRETKPTFLEEVRPTVKLRTLSMADLGFLLTRFISL